MSDLSGAAPGAGAGLVAVGAPTIPTGANVETVGVGKEYATISAAVAAATDGTVILVDAGTYTNDFSTITSKITIEGVGGMVDLTATVAPPNLKGIMTVDDDATIENVSFSGASIPDADGGNGAGIRYEGGQLNLVNDAFSHNEDGILANAVIGSLTTNTITADHCLFQDNGSGSGYTHNIYIGDVGRFTLENSISEGANVGHEVKSRAETNLITNNVIQDGPTGTASYSIDLPDGGNDTVTDNLIEKGPESENDAMVHFGGEGIPYVGSSLAISGNDFVDDLGPQAVAVLNQTAISASINGNQFTDIAPGQIVQGPATGNGNVDGDGNPLPPIDATGVLPGNTLTILASDPNPHVVTLDGNYGAVQDLGTGLLTVDDQVGHVIVIGGTGGLDLTEEPGTGGSSYTTVVGATDTLTLVGQDLVDSNGHDTINTGNGNLTVQIDGDAVINNGTGADQFAVIGSAIVAENGSNSTYAVGPNASLSVTGNDVYTEIQNDGGSVSLAVVQDGNALSMSIVGGASDLRIYSGAMNLTTAGGTQGSTIRVGAGTASITSAGPDTIDAGSGSDTVIVEGRASVYAGNGTLAVFGRGNSGATVYGDAGTTTIGGDSGGITYVGGAQANTVNSVLSDDTLIGGAGRLTVLGGSREAITGGAGGLTFNALVPGNGADTITTAAGASDRLDLTDADTVTSRGNDVIDAGSGNQQLSVAGRALIENGTGTNTIDVTGTAAVEDRGQDWVTVAAGATLAIRAGLLARVSETDGVVGFAASAGTHAPTTPGNGAYSAVLVSGGSASISGGSDQAVSVSTNAGSSTNVTLYSGTTNVASNGADTIRAVSGNDTITVYGGGASVLGGAGDLDIVVDAASQATPSLRFIGGTGTANLALTSDAGDITFGAGRTTVAQAGTGPADIYRFLAGQGGGVDTITGFRTGIDHLSLQGVSVASSTVVGGSTNLILSDHTSLTLVGVIIG